MQDLFEACAAKDVDVVKALLKAGADPNSRDERGVCALDYASAKVDVGRPNGVAIALVEAGADMSGRCPRCTLGVGEHAAESVAKKLTYE